MLDYDIKPFEITELFKINKFYTMFSRNCENGSRSNDESHDFWECLYIIDGGIHQSVDGKIYSVEKGDMIFCKPLAFHHSYAESEQTAKLFVFSFSMEKHPDDFATDTVYRLNAEQKKIIHKLIDFAERLAEKVHFTEEEIDSQKETYINYDFIRPLLAFSKNPANMSIAETYICELFLSIYNFGDTVNEADSFHAGVYKKAVLFMSDNISAKLSLCDIAKHCCVSETSLKKIFLNYSNLGIHEHFLKMKINHAITLLKSGERTSEIASQIGFSSQAYFSAAFKRETGLTPREYLKRS